MTGPEHYREAELLAETAAGFVGLPNEGHVQQARVAQVHATLALAAAQGCNDPTTIIRVDGDLTEAQVAMIRAELTRSAV